MYYANLGRRHLFLFFFHNYTLTAFSYCPTLFSNTPSIYFSLVKLIVHCINHVRLRYYPLCTSFNSKYVFDKFNTVTRQMQHVWGSHRCPRYLKQLLQCRMRSSQQLRVHKVRAHSAGRARDAWNTLLFGPFRATRPPQWLCPTYSS